MDPVLTFTTGWDLILHQSDESQMGIPDFSCWRFFWIVAEDFSFNHIDGQVLCFKSVFPYGNFFSQAIKRCG